MKKHKKWMVLCFCICMNLLTTSCWDYREVEDYVQVLGLAIDKDKYSEEYILTIEAIDALSTEDEIEVNIVEARGITIFSAIRNFINITGKKTSMTHCSTVILGKDAIDEGLIPVLDLIDRDVEIRADNFMFISNAETAKDVLIRAKDRNEIVSFKPLYYSNSGSYNGESIMTRAHDIIRNIEVAGVDPIVASLDIEDIEVEIAAISKGVYIFRGDKLAGYLDENQTKLVNLLLNNDLRSFFEIETSEGVKVEFEIISCKSKIEPKKINKEIVMEMDVAVNVAVAEIAGNDKEYLEKGERYKLKKTAEDLAVLEIQKLLSILQRKYRSDILGFGESIKNKYPKEWDNIKDNWREEYERINSEVNCNVNIRVSGLKDGVIKEGK